MTTIKLNDLPKDKEFEEYVAAYFQCSGYYIEKSIINRGKEEVLELDVIMTSYDDSFPKSQLCEMKSKGWGFSDVFKVKGWLDYIKIPRGLFIVQEDRAHFDFFEKIAKEMRINLVRVDDIKNIKGHLKFLTRRDILEENDMIMWRYSYWLERNILKLITSKKKSIKNEERYKALDRYYFEVNSGIFFTQNIIDKIMKLYDLFKDNPKLSAKVGNEAIGNDFTKEHQNIPIEIFTKTFYKCELTDIQLSTFVEQTSKLTILKNLVDYYLFKQKGDKKRTDDIYAFWGKITLSKLTFLPESFKNSLKELSNEPYFSRYPIFWQWFLWFFGGFILMDFEEQEYQLMLEKTGIPVEEIPTALSVFDRLFPQEKSWFFDPPHSNVKILQMFPIPFRGVGANVRRLYYSDDKSFEGLKPKLTKKHTYNDLIVWNNLLVEVLDKEFK